MSDKWTRRREIAAQTDARNLRSVGASAPFYAKFPGVCGLTRTRFLAGDEVCHYAGKVCLADAVREQDLARGGRTFTGDWDD